MYCVIIGDIIHSKELKEEQRNESSDVISQVLDKINIRYKSNILADFGIVRGDGFEGVLFSQQYAPQIIQEIIKSLYMEGIKVRISAVMDELTIVSANRNKADGMAFHRALEKIDELREKKSDHWFQVAMETNSIAQPLVDSIMQLLEAMTLKWTDKQTEIVWNMMECSNQQSLVSRKLNISKSLVNRQVKATQYDVYSNAWENLENYLISYDEAIVSPVEIDPDYTTYYSIGTRKNELRDYAGSAHYLLKALEIAKSKFGEDSPNLVPIYNGLAESYLEQSINEEISASEKNLFQSGAEEVIKNSFRCQNKLPKMRIQYAQTLNLYGTYYVKIQKYNEALACYEEGKRIIEELLGLDNPNLSAFLNNIAIVYFAKEKYEKAIEFYYKALELAEKTKDEEPVDYANELYNIGLCYVNLGNYDKALEKLEESLEILITILPVKNKLVVRGKQAIERVKNYTNEKG